MPYRRHLTTAGVAASSDRTPLAAKLQQQEQRAVAGAVPVYQKPGAALPARWATRFASPSFCSRERAILGSTPNCDPCPAQPPPTTPLDLPPPFLLRTPPSVDGAPSRLSLLPALCATPCKCSDCVKPTFARRSLVHFRSRLPLPQPRPPPNPAPARSAPSTHPRAQLPTSTLQHGVSIPRTSTPFLLLPSSPSTLPPPPDVRGHNHNTSTRGAANSQRTRTRASITERVLYLSWV